MLASVDGTSVLEYDTKRFYVQFLSQKFHHAALHYETRISTTGRHIFWVRGCFSAGKFNHDSLIALNMINLSKSSDNVIADKGNIRQNSGNYGIYCDSNDNFAIA